MYLSVFREGHALDRVPPGTSQLPISMFDGLRVDAATKETSRPEGISLYSDRPGVYEVTRGDGALANARRQGRLCVTATLQHHPRWLSPHRAPSEAVVASEAPPRPGGRWRKLRGGVIGADNLAQRLLRPYQGGLLERLQRATGKVLRVQDGLLVDRRANPVDLEALLSSGGKSQGTLDQLLLEASRVDVASALQAAADLTARLRAWSVELHEGITVSVIPGIELLKLLDCGAPEVGKERELFVPLRELVQTAFEGRPEARAYACALAAPVASFPSVQEAVVLARLWDEAALAGLEAPWLRGRGTSSPFCEMPNPFRPLVEIYATGLLPLGYGPKGLRLGLPRSVNDSAGQGAPGA